MHKNIRTAAAVVLLSLAMAGMSGCSIQVMEPEETGAQESEEGQKEGLAEQEVQSIRAQDDFYGYVNQEQLAQCQLNHYSEGFGAFQGVETVVEQELFDMLEEIVNAKEPYQPGSNAQLVRDAYVQCLSYLNGAGSSAKEFYEKQAEQIQAAQSVEELREVIAHVAREQGIYLFFSPGVTENIYRAGEYAVCFQFLQQAAGFSLEEIYEKDETRQELYLFAGNVLIALGEERDIADRKAKDFVYSMIELAEHTDYEKQKLANLFEGVSFVSAEELDCLLTNNTSAELAAAYGFEEISEWGMIDKEQLLTVDGFFEEENLENLKTYMLCSLAYEYRDFLKRDYAFLDSVQMHMSKEDIALLYIRNTFAEQVSALYAAAYYTEQMNQDIHRMYEDIKDSYRELITEADWLSQETRAGMLRKLENMTFVCGGGKEREAEEDATGIVGEDAFVTFLNQKRRTMEAARALVGTKVDREEANMPAHSVNAAYSPQSNSFTVAVAIMHAPFYSPEQSYAENLGGLGMVMAHEIGHAFDSTCLAFDADGVYNPEWIGEEDRIELEKRLRGMEDYYAAFTVMDIYHVDGAKTSGENYADKGAMECLMNIVTNPQEQRVLFENYAGVWCSMVEDTYAIRLLEEDEHSPDRVRTNAVLSSTPEFYEVYEVKQGDGMYISPQLRVSRWK